MDKEFILSDGFIGIPTVKNCFEGGSFEVDLTQGPLLDLTHDHSLKDDFTEGQSIKDASKTDGYFSESDPGLWSVDVNPPDQNGKISYEIKNGKEVCLNVPFQGTVEELRRTVSVLSVTRGSNVQGDPVKMDDLKELKTAHVFRVINEDALKPVYEANDQGVLQVVIDGKNLPMPEDGYIKILLKFLRVSIRRCGWIFNADLLTVPGPGNIGIPCRYCTAIHIHVKQEMRDNSRKPDRLNMRKRIVQDHPDLDRQDDPVPKKRKLLPITDMTSGGHSNLAINFLEETKKEIIALIDKKKQEFCKRMSIEGPHKDP